MISTITSISIGISGTFWITKFVDRPPFFGFSSLTGRCSRWNFACLANCLPSLSGRWLHRDRWPGRRGTDSVRASFGSEVQGTFFRLKFLKFQWKFENLLRKLTLPNWKTNAQFYGSFNDSLNDSTWIIFLLAKMTFTSNWQLEFDATIVITTSLWCKVCSHFELEIQVSKSRENEIRQVRGELIK